MNVFVTGLEVLIWREYEISAGIVLPIFAAVNAALAAGLIFGWGQVMGRQIERLHRRPRLVGQIDVPLPGERARDPATA